MRWPLLLTLAFALPAYAHQPVQDMAPRWSEGFGFQIRHESRSSSELLSGRSKVPNPLGRKEEVRETWLEGVYTFRREVRVTAKIPYVEKSRVSNTGESQRAQGLGDATFAVPLKRYTNDGPKTWNFSLTPQVRVPIGSTGGDYPIGDGSTDFGLSLSYSSETPFFYQLYDLFVWKNGTGRKGIRQGDQAGLDINWGIHPYHSAKHNAGLFLMWDVSMRYEDRGMGSQGITGGKRVSTGPIAVFYWQDMMARFEYKRPIYERVWGTSVSRGDELTASIGFVY